MMVGAGATFAVFCLAIGAAESEPDTTAIVSHIAGRLATADYQFEEVRHPSRNDLAERGTFAIVDGRQDRNGGGLDKLHDGKLPTEEDQPSENFFFRAGSGGGRLLVDLGAAVEIEQVNSYSWHPTTRGPQLYKLYASTGDQERFNSKPASDVDPITCGWTLIGQVDTRPSEGDPGGQYGVSVRAREGTIGTYRYLMFDISATERTDPFGNTFFSEIDVLGPESEGVAAEPATLPRSDVRQEVVVTDQGHRIVIDTTEAPDLTEWARDELAPVVKQWYPKIVEMLPSDGFEAPASATIVFSDRMRGVAATGGTRVSCAAAWFRRELDREAKGAVVHELVHVVQQYGRARRVNPDPSRTPGWLVEGIPDYIRWYLYEPESRGAQIGRANIARARYDGSYRISANFIHWATQKFDKDLVRKLNAAARDGKYTDKLWDELTEHSLEELDVHWRAELDGRGADK